MREIPFVLGRVVISKQGHDKGRWFAVVGTLDDKHVLIADGDTRKIAKPKKKQQKHLRAKPVILADIATALTEGKPLLDSDIRKALAALTEKEENCGTETRPPKKKEECALVKE